MLFEGKRRARGVRIRTLSLADDQHDRSGEGPSELAEPSALSREEGKAKCERPTRGSRTAGRTKAAAGRPLRYRIDEALRARAQRSWLLTPVKVPLRVVPRLLTATMMAIEMPAAMRPYSMAVAPV
jgi:hypothetical protein